MSTTKTYKEKLQLLLNTKTQFKNDIINAGGTIDNSTPFSSYPAIYKTLKGGAPDGTAVEVTTEADMDALLVSSNVGKFYKYTGETTDKYTKDAYYIIQDSDNPIVQECGGGGSVVIQQPVYTLGTGAIPNTGTIESVFINTNLTSTEVDAIIKSANLTYVDLDGLPSYLVLCVATDEDDTLLGIIADFSSLVGKEGFAICIWPSGGELMPLYVSASLTALGLPPGWQTDLISQMFNGNELVLQLDAMSIFEGSLVGTQNEALTNLIYAKVMQPTGNYETFKTLSGTYKTIEPEIVLNTDETDHIDVFTDLINEDDKTFTKTVNLKYVTPSKDAEIERLKAYEPLSGLIDGSITSFTIPSTITRLKTAAFAGTNIKEIIIPQNIQEIPYACFYACSSLSSVTLPNSMRGTLGYKSFENSSIKNIIIPEGIVTLGDSAFEGCRYLQSIELPSTLQYIFTKAFYNCSSLTSIVLPASIKDIYGDVFGNCTCLESITIPESITQLRTSFGYCTNLKTINHSHTIEITSNGAFFECNSLTSISNFIISGDNAFWFSGVSTCENITLRSSADGAFMCSKLTSLSGISIPTSIPSSAFSLIETLLTAHIPEGTTAIGRGAFSSCTSLADVRIPESVKTIGDAAFDGCTALTEIVIPTSTTDIGEKAFYNCKKLSNINISEGVKVINSEAFRGCSALTEITLPSTIRLLKNNILAFSSCIKIKLLATVPPLIESDTFKDINNSQPVTVEVPIGCGNAYRNDPDWAYNISSYNITIVESNT